MAFQKKGGKPEETFDSEKGFVAPKNKGGRPRVHVPKNVITRETRTPLDGIRDKFPAIVEDPNYKYSWPIDDDENGYVIMQFLNAGYNFVQSREQKISKNSVYSSNDVGSIIRVPNVDGRFHYLMKISKDLYNEDQANNLKRVKELESSMFSTRAEGMYGKVGYQEN